MDQVDTPQMEHPGRDKVDQLCIFLVSLDRKISTLTDEQAQRLVTLWEALDDSDKQKPKYAGRTSSNPLAGGFHSTRKRSGTNPSLDAAERVYLSRGTTAQRPNTTRITECLCIQLFREFQSPANRMKGLDGRKLQVAECIKQVYTGLKQLLEDCTLIMERTTLHLVPINNTTINNWLHEKQKN